MSFSRNVIPGSLLSIDVRNAIKLCGLATEDLDVPELLCSEEKHSDVASQFCRLLVC